MIELNLTYEESKKILELGYDFSSVCIDWSTEHTKYIKVGSKLIEPELVEQLELAHNQELHPNNLLWNYSLEFSEVESKIQDFINFWAIDWITYSPPIPIIPKAALEACLPDLSGSTWLKNLRTNWMILDLDPHIIKLESIFKAFTWCHEHYPEELKKKFNEVMG